MRKLKLLGAVSLLLIIGMSASEISAQSKVNVRFRAGTSSGTYNGSIRGDRYIDYVLAAKEGQTMEVTLARRSGETSYFNILPSGSEVAISDDAREVNEWTGTLPSTGKYVVRVYLPKAARLARRTGAFRITFRIDSD